MVKILHTSDWHMGHTLYNYDRTEEQVSMLQQIADIVQEHKPDLFLLSGDVYHTAQPSAAVQTLFTNALMEIHDANPSMVIVMTAGNHDSGAKHDIFKIPWKALNVHTFGNIDVSKLEDLIVEIPGKASVIAVPYIHQRNLPKGFYQNLLDKAIENDDAQLPIIMMAHTTVKGCDYSGHDNASEYTVGSIDSYDLEDMGTGYDYLALGHIHHAQFVRGGNRRVRYSGAPIPISFDENYPHSVSIVEIDKHGETPKVNDIEISNCHPLVTLPTEGATTWEKAKDLLANFPDDIEAYIRLNVLVEDFLPPEANVEAKNITREKKCRFCLINAQRLKSRSEDAKTMSIQEFKEEKPMEIARRYAEDLGVVFDDDMKELFQETLDSIEEDDRK